MKITRLEVSNIKSFEHADITFSNTINVIIGANNNGKTTLLNCVSVLQVSGIAVDSFKRIYQDLGEIRIWFDQSNKAYFNSEIDNIKITTSDRSLYHYTGELLKGGFGSIGNIDPFNFIIPFQSKRKVGGYSEGITINDVTQVNGNFSNLYAKIDRVSHPQYEPAYSDYISACDEILGFRVTTTNSGGGKKAVYIIRNDDHIAIDTMGEGISNLLGLIVDLCRAEHQLFIIEEPENDIHPRALKKLLELIIRKSSSNQFIITTHSNIVLRYLASVEDSKLFNINMEFKGKIPTSSVDVIDSVEKRKIVLEELGYELFDFELWEYWLILEESSAEKIIRDYIIPWFLPNLNGKVRTFAANSVSQVDVKFEDFNRLFVFLHLQPVYKNKVWVIIDSGDEENKIIDKMKSKYAVSGWNAENFRQFDQHDFEQYYPSVFSAKIKTALAIENKAKRMEEKKELLNEVVDWANTNPDEAKVEFEKSAAPVISLLTELFNWNSQNPKANM